MSRPRVSIGLKPAGLLISRGSQPSADILNSPLHRIFLKGTLSGEYLPDSESWMVPTGVDQHLTLHRLIKHLEKYGAEVSLDSACAGIIDNWERRCREHEERLNAAEKAKKSRSKSVHDDLLCRLGKVMQRPLTDQQVLALHHLEVAENAANFSVPGSGKTSVALAYYAILRNESVAKSLLVIGPLSCFEPWETEFELCFGRKPRCLRIAGLPKEDRRAEYLMANRYELVLTSYHTALRDLPDLIALLGRRPYLVILDESHYVKRPKGGALAEAVLKLASFAKRRMILTGTPMPNGLPDLWSQVTFLWPEHPPLGPVDEFLRLVESRDEGDVLRQVAKRISPLYFRTTKKDLGLPGQEFILKECEFSPLQRRIYTGVTKRFLSQIDEAPHDRAALREWRRARAVRLLQIASNPALLRAQCDEFKLPPLDAKGLPLSEAIEYYGRYEIPQKVNLACEIVREKVANGSKVIIWSTFVHNLSMLARMLEDLSPVVVHGGIAPFRPNRPELDRERLLYRFRTRAESKVLIANPAACAESISLHSVCHDAVYLDRSFNCAHYLQSLDRIHRLGLDRGVITRYYILAVRESIDLIVNSRLVEKVSRMHEVLEGRLPGRIPGYWSEELGDEDEVDFELVDDHIRRFRQTSRDS